MWTNLHDTDDVKLVRNTTTNTAIVNFLLQYVLELNKNKSEIF